MYSEGKPPLSILLTTKENIHQLISVVLLVGSSIWRAGRDGRNRQVTPDRQGTRFKKARELTYEACLGQLQGGKISA